MQKTRLLNKSIVYVIAVIISNLYRESRRGTLTFVVCTLTGAGQRSISQGLEVSPRSLRPDLAQVEAPVLD